LTSTTSEFEIATRKRSRIAAFIALGVSVVCISWSAPFVRWAHVPGITSAFYRALVAAIVVVPYWLVTRDRTRTPSRNAILLALLGGVFFGFDLALFNTAVLKTSATTAMVLTNNSPVLVGIGTWLIFRERPKLTFWIGLILALVGCIVIVAGDVFKHGSVVVGDVGGDMIAASASVFFAAYLITTGRIRSSMGTVTFTALAIIGSAATMLIVCLIAGAPLTGFHASAWPWLIALGLITQLGGYIGVAYALGRLPATAASVILLAVMPVTALLAVLFLGEPLQPAQLIGGTLVLAGIFAVNRRTNDAKSAKRNTTEPESVAA
jgi:drug/metabolite transporter (DMT)-like permease